MGVLGLLLALAIATGDPVQGRAGLPTGSSADWAEAWAGLARLERLGPGSQPFRELWAELDALQREREHAARKAKADDEAFRARVLRAQLSRLDGASVRPLAQAPIPWTFASGEAWRMAQVLEDGPARSRACLRALEDAQSDALEPRVALGLEVGWSDVRALRLDAALALALAVHDRAGTMESAILLARVHRERDESGRADAALASALERARQPQERGRLLVERGRAALGAREDGAALHALGAAFAQGAPEAGILLAVLILAEGDVPRSRRLFRSLLDEPSAQADAWKGWGLALVQGGAEVRASAEDAAAIPQGSVADNPAVQPH